jgi:hypothetical protein
MDQQRVEVFGMQAQKARIEQYGAVEGASARLIAGAELRQVQVFAKNDVQLLWRVRGAIAQKIQDLWIHVVAKPSRVLNKRSRVRRVPHFDFSDGLPPRECRTANGQT